MQLRWLKHKEIDKSKWDAAIESSHNQLIYGFSWFLDVTCPGWGAIVGGDYEYLFPVKGKRKFGIPYFYMPLFVQQLGVYSSQPLSAEVCEMFLEQLNSRFKAIDVYLNYACHTENPAFKLSKRIGQLVPLDKGYEVIREGYSTNLVRNLKKAVAQGISIVEDPRPELIRSLFEGGRGLLLGEIKKADYQRLESLLVAIQQHAQTLILTARDKNGEPVAGGFFAISGQRVIYIKGGVTNTGRESNAMHLLVDFAIQRFASEGISIFDFGGSVAEPLIRFNRGFGGIDYTYYCFRNNRLPKTIEFFKKVF